MTVLWGETIIEYLHIKKNKKGQYQDEVKHDRPLGGDHHRIYHHCVHCPWQTFFKKKYKTIHEYILKTKYSTKNRCRVNMEYTPIFCIVLEAYTM